MLAGMHFCLIDDDPRFLVKLQEGLVELGHEAEAFQSSAEGLGRLLAKGQFQPDVLLLDVMMPDLDGWEVLARYRAAGGKTAVIFVTGRSEVDDRVRGLMLSADDYVIKPFDLRELLARATTVVRRQGYEEPIDMDGLVVYRNKPRVEFEGRRIEVSHREHAFLELLCSTPGHVYSREVLLAKLWDIHFDPQTNVVEVLVARTRKKLGAQASGVIETVVGQGDRATGLGSA